MKSLTKLNELQYEMLKNTFHSLGITQNDFCFSKTDYIFEIYNKIEPTYRFRVSASISNHIFDVYCNPYTYMESIFISCDLIDDIIKLANEWVDVLNCKLKDKEYIHKIFISHSSYDKGLITEFVDKILFLSCGLLPKNIAYTSLESTGVDIGQDIPQYIKQNIAEANYFICMISDNYKSSEICLNEMGAALALKKEIIPILLPNVSFNKIGWFNTFNKAIKINNEEALDHFYERFNKSNLAISDWNRYKNSFLEYCKAKF